MNFPSYPNVYISDVLTATTVNLRHAAPSSVSPGNVRGPTAFIFKFILTPPPPSFGIEISSDSMYGEFETPMYEFLLTR